MTDIYAIDWNIGAHIRFSQRIAPTVKEGINCGMYTIQFFMGNPQSCKRQRITDEDIKETQLFTNKFPMFIYSHFPYIANFAGKSGPDGLAWNGNKAVDGFLSTILKELEYELYILSQIGHGVVIHPGSHPDREKGHLTVAKSMNRIKFSEGSMVLLENCAGEGNKLCRNFEEIKVILDNIDGDKRKYVGVCVDTAHIWGQGDYDISKISEVDRMFNDFNSVIGLEYFKLLHLNDSEVPLGAKKDRHACLGTGYIWGESFDSLIYLLDKCKQLKIPMVLETKGSDMFTLAKLCEDREEDMVCPVCINCAPKIVTCPCCKNSENKNRIMLSIKQQLEKENARLRKALQDEKTKRLKAEAEADEYSEMVRELQEKIWTIEATAEEQERKFVENEKNLLAMINIYENSQNIGERDEILLQLRLIHLNNNKNFDELKEIFGEEASEGISILNIDTDDEIDKPNKLSKAPQGAKADCRIRMTKTNNVYNTSIKSLNGANPAILNHTPRSAKIFNKGGIFNDLVECLDRIAEEYRNKRGNNLIGEDTLISNLTCLKHDPVLKEQVIKILLYFVFDGTGKGYSKYKSDAIMTCQGDKIIFRKCDSIQNKKLYIESIYDKIVISFRDKGMPKVPNEYCKQWVYDEIKPDGSIKQKGSLHIRIR